MFTGIVQTLGIVASFDGSSLALEVATYDDDPWALGESIAINGCCLTLVEASDKLRFDLSEETLNRTAFKKVKEGEMVNVERAMKAGDRFGGHWVQGHVDAVGVLESVTQTEQGIIVRFHIPLGYEPYVVDKGSIAINGISLTVVSPTDNQFDVWVIPHTWEHTNLSRLRPGDEVNLEFDILAKYVERQLEWFKGAQGRSS